MKVSTSIEISKPKEDVWKAITDSVDNEYYATRAESHGSVYVSRLSLAESAGITTLTFSFSGEAQTLVAKILSALMGFMIKSSMVKELQKDLEDIKSYVEQE